MIMYDGPSWGYTVNVYRHPRHNRRKLLQLRGREFRELRRSAPSQRHVLHERNALGQQRLSQGERTPIVQIFPDETVIPSTGPAPSWADVWAQVGIWNNDLPANCGVAPYNADNGVPLIVFENAGGFTHQDASGSYYWIEPSSTALVADQFTLNISPATDGGTLDNFLATAVQNPDKLAWSNAFKGFNSIQSTWGTGRIMDQECGQTWITSLTESNQYYPTTDVPYVQIATWNDYNEGTEIESGIDNCYTVSANTSGKTLSWTLNATNSDVCEPEDGFAHGDLRLDRRGKR